MCNQYLIISIFYTVFQLIKFSSKNYGYESFTESKFDSKNVNIVKARTLQVLAFKRNRIFEKIKHLNEYKTFEIQKIKLLPYALSCNIGKNFTRFSYCDLILLA